MSGRAEWVAGGAESRNQAERVSNREAVLSVWCGPEEAGWQEAETEGKDTSARLASSLRGKRGCMGLLRARGGRAARAMARQPLMAPAPWHAARLGLEMCQLAHPLAQEGRNQNPEENLAGRAKPWRSCEPPFSSWRESRCSLQQRTAMLHPVLNGPHQQAPIPGGGMWRRWPPSP